jgi:hypothetical protein
MASFQLCYNLNKYTSDRDFILGLHPASWAVAVIGHLIRANICGIVNWLGNTKGCPHHSQPVILRTYSLRVMIGVCLNVVYLSWIWLDCVKC